MIERRLESVVSCCRAKVALGMTSYCSENVEPLLQRRRYYEPPLAVNAFRSLSFPFRRPIRKGHRRSLASARAPSARASAAKRRAAAAAKAATPPD